MQRINFHTALDGNGNVRTITVVRKIEIANGNGRDKRGGKVVQGYVVITRKINDIFGPVNVNDVSHSGRISVLQVEVSGWVGDPSDVKRGVKATGVGFLKEFGNEESIRIVSERNIASCF